MTVLHTERHQVDPAHRGSFETDASSLVDAMRVADGFLWADISWSVVDAEVANVVSEWRTPDALDTFLGGDAYVRFIEANDVRLREAATVRRFTSG